MREAEVLRKIERDVAEMGVRGLAREAGVSAAYVSEVMRGTRHVGAKFAKYYGLRLTRIDPNTLEMDK